MNAKVAAEKYIYGTLSGDGALAALVGDRIVGHRVPTGMAYPLVYYTDAGPLSNYLTMNAIRVWSEFVYAVRYVDRVESYMDLEDGAAAIERLLHRKQGSNDSGEIVASIYQSPFSLMEVDQGGSEVRHLGGLYRLQVQ